MSPASPAKKGLQDVGDGRDVLEKLSNSRAHAGNAAGHDPPAERGLPKARHDRNSSATRLNPATHWSAPTPATANLQSGRQSHPTCEQCGGPRVGHEWKTIGGRGMAVCAACKAAKKARIPCPRKCGPDGQFGPACRYQLPAPGVPHDGACAPSGGIRPLEVILALQAARRAEAIHG